MTLQIVELCVDLGGDRVVDALSFDVQGGWFGVLGANGSGKTTLLRCLVGRLQPASGQIIIEGRQLARDPAARSLQLGFGPPIETLPQMLSVKELLLLAAQARGVSLHLAGDLYESLGVERLLGRLVGELSSGAKQRVANYLAFIGDPQLVVLDEPFNWLDPVAGYEFKRAVKAFVSEGRTVISALHDIASFITHCDAGLVLRDGKAALRITDRGAAWSDSPEDFERHIYETLSQEASKRRDGQTGR